MTVQMNMYFFDFERKSIFKHSYTHIERKSIFKHSYTHINKTNKRNLATEPTKEVIQYYRTIYNV